MSEKTNIEWATSTGNPWIGCTKVSPGCKNCYAAELDATKFSKTMGGATKQHPVSHWGKGAPRVRTKAFWKDAVKWDIYLRHCPQCGPVMFTKGQLPSYAQNKVTCPKCYSTTTRPRIFPSLCDILDREVPLDWFGDFLQLVKATPNLDWLTLTKRIEEVLPLLKAVLAHYGQTSINDDFCAWVENWIEGQPPENLWLGVSVENQEVADLRIPQLLRIPAKVRFLSVEPLLEEVDLSRYLCLERRSEQRGGFSAPWVDLGWHKAAEPTLYEREKIDWVIVGGESGANRRDCGVQAIEDVARQCVAASVPCFVKQDCAFRPGQQGRISDEVWRLKQFPKV